MRTVLPGSRRDSLDDLVRQRMDTLFGPDHQPRPAHHPPDHHPPGPAPVRGHTGPPGAAPADSQHPRPYPVPVGARTGPPGTAPADAVPTRPAPRRPTPTPGPLPAAALPTAPLLQSADRTPPDDPLPPPPLAPFRAHARPRSLLPLALQERFDLDRRAVVGLSVLLVLALGYGVQHFWAGRPESVALPAAEVSASPALSADPLSGPTGRAIGTAAAGGAVGLAGAAAGATGVVVDVAGRVHAPGVRTLRPGARVQDALRAAGGALAGTDLTNLNLARLVNDGEEIIVGPAAAGAGAVPGAAAGAPAGAVLSLNSATAEQLDALPGLGPVLAQRIIQYREEHGGFRSVDQLRQISGFGERRLKDLRPRLRP